MSRVSPFTSMDAEDTSGIGARNSWLPTSLSPASWNALSMYSAAASDPLLPMERSWMPPKKCMSFVISADTASAVIQPDRTRTRNAVRNRNPLKCDMPYIENMTA